MATSRRRSGVVKYLGTVLDDTKDLVDDLLDRARDVEHDLRDTARRTFDHDEEEDAGSGKDLAELKLALSALTKKVDELARLQSEKKSASRP